MNCITYARVSTERQAEKELSIPAQAEAMREYAQRHGWSVLEEYGEPGASARTAERPVLRQMLARCKREPRVEVVLVHKVDRLARNVFDHATIRTLLKQRGIRLASVIENVDDTVPGQLVENIMASIAQFYSSNLSEEVKKGMRVMVDRGGWPHLPPRGYMQERTPEGRPRIVPDPALAPAVRAAFELYAEGGASFVEVADGLKRMGMTTRTGNAVPSSYVQAMLGNPFYRGVVRWKGEDRPGTHEAILPPELFDRVQEAMRRRKSAPGARGRLFLLRGTATCAECGEMMTAETHGEHSYYRCLRNTRRRGCRAPFSNVERSHEALRRLYAQLRLPQEVRAAMLTSAQGEIMRRAAESARSARTLTMQRVRLRERMVALADGLSAGSVPRDVYESLSARQGAELAALDRALDAGQADPEAECARVERVLDLASSLDDLHRSLPAPDQRLLLRAIFRQIVLDRGAVKGFSLNPPFDPLLSAAPGREVPPESVVAAARLLERALLHPAFGP